MGEGALPDYSGPPWRLVPPGNRPSFECLDSESRARIEAQLEIESRQIVLERRAAAARYAAMSDTRNGMIVNGDLVNQLLPFVQGNPTMGIAGLHAASLEVMMDLFKVFQWVEERAHDLGKDRPVLVTMGGQASGKTSLASFAKGVGAILDAPHTDGDGLVKRLTKLLGQGKEVWLVWVHRNPRHALHSMLMRAVEEGRPVALAQMAGAHYHAPQAFETVGRAFRGQSRMHLYHACNLAGPDDIKVLGGRLDREGKDALNVLKDLPAWSEVDFMTCLVDGYFEALRGQRGWAGTPPASDLMSFLNARLTGADQDRAFALSKGMIRPSLGHRATVPRSTLILPSTLETPLIEPGDACGMIAEALRQGIDWNQGRLEEAFGQAYRTGRPPATLLFN